MIGLIKKICKFDFKFIEISFVKSLIASEIGCKIPINAVLLGPFRFCEYLRIFRSMRVKKAILMKINKMINKKLIIKIIKCKA